ncbi:MAG: hypothetical protein JW904_00230 [Spirochaetales bacterium]|nr:hypothetical protein [Spirochaetales bacterium]
MKKIILFLTFLNIFSAFSQTTSEKQVITVYSATVTDKSNAIFTLKEISVSGYTWFHCLLKDSMFKMPFDLIRSITFIETAEPPFKGYAESTLAYAAGGQVQLYVDLDNYWIEGVNEALQITMKIPLNDISTIIIIQETVPEQSSEAVSTIPEEIFDSRFYR